MNPFLRNLIAQGEHQQLEFKFEITDPKRIARTLTAFANTDGGRMLIGVKDNGVIAGVRSEEEYYMLQAAAQMYCRPEVPFLLHKFNDDGKTVLIVEVHKDGKKLYRAPGNDNQWTVYLRVKDQNIAADNILVKTWNRRYSKAPTRIKYSRDEQRVLDLLKTNSPLTVLQIARIATLASGETEKILTDLMSIGLIKPVFAENQINYTLNDSQD